MSVHVILMVVAWLAIVHAFIFNASTSWRLRQCKPWRTDPPTARLRRDAPPWYVRYTDLFV